MVLNTPFYERYSHTHMQLLSYVALCNYGTGTGQLKGMSVPVKRRCRITGQYRLPAIVTSEGSIPSISTVTNCLSQFAKEVI